jgi:hypothetical protein
MLVNSKRCFGVIVEYFYHIRTGTQISYELLVENSAEFRLILCISHLFLQRHLFSSFFSLLIFKHILSNSWQCNIVREESEIG